ncbi:MAG: hypothetical protein EPO11_01030 [Gammaproteobacteria bacterium]|nr:MAG: hypothetical protein EPO11_01030 [Gammaproteobacteria bacterium]
MKKPFKSTLGVTLLEVMLVLAIAAMIVVMSVRYYQSANQNSQANTFVEQIGAITAGVENLTQGTGDYTNKASLATLTNFVPANMLTQVPWGGGATYAATASGYTFTAATAASANLCALFTQKLVSDNHYTVTCSVVTYSGNK